MDKIIWFLLIGIAAGWLAGQFAKGRGFGLIGNLIIGVIGAVLGGYLFKLIGMSSSSLLGDLLMATGGAIVLLILLSIVAGAQKR